MKQLHLLKSKIQGLIVLALCLAIPAGSWATITNTASATYQDAASNPYTATSNMVSITTPPVVTVGSFIADVNVAITPYQIVATNSPTSFSASGLPLGLTLNPASGLISGTPTTAGVSSVNMTASNAAGVSAVAILTITVRGSATIVLTKTSSAANAKSGDTITFTIGYQNTGAGTASSVVIKDVIPTGSTLVAGSITAGGVFSANAVTWTIPTVGSGVSGSVSFQVTVN